MGDDEELYDEAEDTPDGAPEAEPAEGTLDGDPDPDAAEDGEGPVDDEGEADGEDEGALPQGVRKRLAKVTAKRREAEARAKELEDEVARLRDRAESPGLYRALAERHGILPDLIGAREAKGLRELDEAERGAEALRGLLEELEDRGESETELDGRTVTRAQLRKSLREQERRAGELREGFGDVARRLRRRTLELVRLGLAAEKARAERAAKPKAAETKPRGDAGGPARVRRGDVNGLARAARPARAAGDDLDAILTRMVRRRQTTD